MNSLAQRSRAAVSSDLDHTVPPRARFAIWDRWQTKRQNELPPILPRARHFDFRKVSFDLPQGVLTFLRLQSLSMRRPNFSDAYRDAVFGKQ